MKALVIAPQPFFSYRGTPLSVYYRALVMAQMGVEIDLLTYGEGQDVDIPGVRIIRIPRFQRLGNVKIGPSLLKLFLDFFILLKAIGLLSRYEYSFVQPHEEAVFIGYLLKPFFKFKLLYDMHSSLPEQLVNFKFTYSRLLIGGFQFLERRCLQTAEVTITICPSLYQHARKITRFNKPIVLIENSLVDPVRLKHAHLMPPIPSVVLPNQRMVVYAGTLERYQGIPLLMRAFQHVLASDSDLVLLIIGGTQAQVEHYTQLSQQWGIRDRCCFTGQVTPELANHYQHQAAVQVSPRVVGTNTPLKIYGQLARKVPIVATRIEAHTQMLNEDVAFLVNPEPEAMAAGILAALDPEGDRDRRVENAQQLYALKYSRQVYEDKMRLVLELLGVLEPQLQSPGVRA